MLAVKVMLYVPAVPAAGVPLNTPVDALNVTPPGSAPLSLSPGAGNPVAVTINEPGKPTVKVELFVLVIAGGCVDGAKLAVTDAGEFMTRFCGFVRPLRAPEKPVN